MGWWSKWTLELLTTPSHSTLVVQYYFWDLSLGWPKAKWDTPVTRSGPIHSDNPRRLCPPDQRVWRMDVFVLWWAPLATLQLHKHKINTPGRCCNRVNQKSIKNCSKYCFEGNHEPWIKSILLTYLFILYAFVHTCVSEDIIFGTCKHQSVNCACVCVCLYECHWYHAHALYIYTIYWQKYWVTPFNEQVWLF